MATNTCTDCGCKKCGCSDAGLISPAPCPTSLGCPTPEPCSEVINAECVVYTGLPIMCGLDEVVDTDTTLADALTDTITYFCDNGGGGGTGPAGPVGPPGIQGAQGVAGPVGPQGTSGSAGGAGTTGATGPQGIQGVAGPVGPAGLNWQGSWSSIGVYAPDDAVGFNGASWFCLNAVGPSASNPLIDPTNWALLASEGAVGPAGPTGASGVAGAAGATGPQGLTGPAGIQGIQGITGPTGAQGPQGIQGIQGVPGTGTQDLWKTFNSTAGFVSATSPTDTITIVGQKEINTSISGNILTINSWRYEIGEYAPAQGGVIFHRWISFLPGGPPSFGTTQNYLVVDTTNLSLGAQYATINVNIPNVESTWDGSTNTTNLIAAGAASGITVGTAAELCFSSTNNTKTDWYLPAVDELSKLWHNRFEVNQGLGVAFGTILNSGVYWSSTENTNIYAWYFYFDYGSSFNETFKSNGFGVRAVRKFYI
jgi:hypothetical protein